ncbi:MAG: PspA/IM30 family protein [Desulfococcaceae bacterium]|nr:PspA/IM30 family protein [Desulfococcaceae bacterium]
MGSFFLRITDVIAANINDMIDRVEDPERIIRQIIREMEENIRRAREGVLDAMSNEKQLGKELEYHRRQAGEWRAKAEKALRTGKEDLARKALARKKEHDRIVADAEDAWKTARNTSINLKHQLRKLENKLEEARRKRSALAARQRAAEARQYMSSTVRCFDKGLIAGDKFERMEGRIVEIEARTEAMTELDDEKSELEKEFADMEAESDVELELEELKKKVAEG